MGILPGSGAIEGRSRAEKGAKSGWKGGKGAKEEGGNYTRWAGLWSSRLTPSQPHSLTLSPSPSPSPSPPAPRLGCPDFLPSHRLYPLHLSGLVSVPPTLVILLSTPFPQGSQLKKIMQVWQKLWLYLDFQEMLVLLNSTIDLQHANGTFLGSLVWSMKGGGVRTGFEVRPRSHAGRRSPTSTPAPSPSTGASPAPTSRAPYSSSSSSSGPPRPSSPLPILQHGMWCGCEVSWTRLGSCRGAGRW